MPGVEPGTFQPGVRGLRKRAALILPALTLAGWLVEGHDLPAMEFIQASGLWSLLLLLDTVLISAWLGQLILRLIGFARTIWLETGGIFLGLGAGLGGLAMLTFCLGAAGQYSSVILRTVFWICLCLSALYSPFKKVSIPTPGQVGWLALLFAASLLLPAVAPDTGFDAYNYHLGIPRLYLTEGGLYPTNHIFYAQFPFLTESLYTLALGIDSEILATLYHWWYGFMTAALLWVFLQRQGFSRLAAGSAALLFVSSPMVAWLMQTAYVDLTLTFYVTAAIYALWRYRNGKRRWVFLAGLFLGLALGVKYTAGLLLPVFMLWIFRQQKKTAAFIDAISLSPPGPAIGFLLITALTFLPWTLRNILFYGNPLAPIGTGFFSNPALSAEDYRHWLAVIHNWAGLPGDWLNYFRAPWLLAFYGNLFKGSPGYLIPLLVIPALYGLWRLRRQAAVVLLVVTASYFFVALLLTSTHVRYFVPVFPLFCLLIAIGLERGFGRRAWWAAVIIFGSLLQHPLLWKIWQPVSNYSIEPSAFRIFSSFNRRQIFWEQRIGGTGTGALYPYLNRTRERGAVLSLALMAQSRLERPLLMAPNSSQATRLSEALIDASLLAAGKTTTGLIPADGSCFRYFQLQGPSGTEAAETPYHPRFFFRAGQELIEAEVFKRGRTQDSEGRTMWRGDLGGTRCISRVEWWAPSMSLRLRVSDDGRRWRRIASEPLSEPPSAASRNWFIRGLREEGVRYVAIPRDRKFHFIQHFLDREGSIRPVLSTPGVLLYRSTMETQRQGAQLQGGPSGAD